MPFDYFEAQTTFHVFITLGNLMSWPQLRANAPQPPPPISSALKPFAACGLAGGAEDGEVGEGAPQRPLLKERRFRLHLPAGCGKKLTHGRPPV